jgi:uncharacterized protein YxjI
MSVTDPSASHKEVTKEQHNSDATLRSVVNPKFCLNSLTKFIVRKKPTVCSNVGGIVIRDSEGREKFKLEELALKEPGLALKDSDGKLILTVKPEGTNKWNVFPTVESKSVNSTGKKESEPLFIVKISACYSKIEVSLRDYEIEGSFAKRMFKISDISRDNSGIAAEVKLKNQVKLNNLLQDNVETIQIDNAYNVEVKPRYDQAFIFGLVAVFEQIRKRPTKK